MITRVRLTNWKAYDHFDMELTPGTTFLIAPNGIGKSSFMDAVSWALDPNAKPDRLRMRRLATTTSVTVDLRVGTTDVVISRTLTKGRAVTPALDGSASIGGETVEVQAALDWAATAWQTDAAFLHRSAFLSDRLLTESGEPNLEEHLVRLYGLDRLREAQSTTEAAAAQLESQARDAKKAKRTTAEQITAAEAEESELDAAAVIASEAANVAAEAAARAASAVREAELRAKAIEAREHWQARYAALVTEARDLLGELPIDVGLDEVLRGAEQGAQAQIVRQAERRAALTERIATVDAALERLNAAEGDCPICRRALDGDSRQHAEEAHHADRVRAADELAALEPGPDDVVADIARLRRQLQDLGAEPEMLAEPEQDQDTLRAEAEAANERARAARDTADEARAQVLRARDRLTELTDGRNAPDAVDLYARAGLLTAGARALDRTIEEVLTRQLGPLSDEVNRRWEALFPDRPGLQVTRKGQVLRTFDDDGEPLPFDAFSSGEKVIAKILMRLSTIGTTAIPFIWIDEPLEHLDPASREYVAHTLALLTADDGISQIVVTTYEDQLARRLEAEDDHPVSLRVLRSADARI